MTRDDNAFYEETAFEARDALVFDCGGDWDGLDDKIVFGSAVEFTSFWGLGFDAMLELFSEWRYANTEKLYVLLLAKAAAVDVSRVDRFAMGRSDTHYSTATSMDRSYDGKVEKAWEHGGKCPKSLELVRSKVRCLREGWASGTPHIAHACV